MSKPSSEGDDSVLSSGDFLRMEIRASLTAAFEAWKMENEENRHVPERIQE